VAAEVDPEVTIEATGAEQVVAEAMAHNAAAGIVCLTGVSSQGRPLTIDLGGLNRDIVLENDVVFGTVNANLRHYAAAAEALARADRGWLERMISRRLPLEEFEQAVDRRPDDVKVVLDL
jgi:threonine dehydrogenase-like Zn-dependent dehydrogenase